MRPEHRRLARHALGLVDGKGVSYRNRFYTRATCPDWMHMVKEGDAERSAPDSNGRAWFSMTRQGAKTALMAGESLCPEDFPPTPEKE